MSHTCLTPPPRLRQVLEHTHGGGDYWPLHVRAAAAHLAVLENLIGDRYQPVLQCAVEAIYQEIEKPTRYDFLGLRRERAFERRFGAASDVRLDLAYTMLNALEALLDKDGYRAVIRAAWEASNLEPQPDHA
ncbi:hypothetical protein FNV65_43760 [Streptomyces sp. S1A1-8]|uniref:hypothetical protein n=1 Tax=Streptomyces sp. RLB1-9 TaxID=2594454 RepID=UPI001165C039|nr:hypothetical protein [Streptomyces sp. RLB1-9]QDO02192.1 hypothetical protein FNV58_45175 [Streptomyces sp. RLB1-9]QDO23926.1 hypothetical protein FNV65_43760 [Streptomyces sp. S1A1-8]